MTAFSLSRDIEIQADPAVVHALLDDFEKWRGWSPWEQVDPNLERTYSGAESGVGAHYAWQGNKKAGSGTMEITGSTPERIDIDLEFLAPFKASYQTVFTLTPAGSGTRLDWTMSGDRNLIFTVLGKLFFDRSIAKDFERGLDSLKACAEQ